MRVTILGPNLPAEAPGELVVHRADCRDLCRGWTLDVMRQERQYAGAPIEEEHASVRAVVESYYGPAAGSFYEEHWGDEEIPEDAWRHYVGEFHFYPCTEGLPEE